MRFGTQRWIACWLVVVLAGPIAAQTAVPDETAIRAARARSNRAIAAHDLAGISAPWLPDFVTVSSTNVRSVGRDAARAVFVDAFATRPGLVFVRTPNVVTVNKQWLQAGENGRWTGNWTAADGPVRVGGIYFAKWVKVDDEWKLLAETYVQTSCSGGQFCDSPPSVRK